MPFNRVVIIPAMLLLVAAGGGVRADDERVPDDKAEIDYFEKHIRPLLIRNCYECHSNKSGNRNSGLVLDSRPGWELGGDRGPAVVPGDLATSLLLQAVRYNERELKMPPGGRLTDEEIARLEHWVLLGAPDPRLEATPATDNTSGDPSDPEAGRNHWAFRTLAQAERPAVANKDWSLQPLDRFVLARLESENLQPASDASRRVLLRRLSFQLTGLPPSPEQTSAFLQDDRPNAVDHFVDEQMASKHFGERWGRHWLDLARYADSNGLDENFLFREAWRYRNWVIDAINADVPYDRFLTEQVAGDLLPYESIEERDRLRIATGFLLIGPKVLLGVPEKRQRMEIADEQIDTVGRAILGQTLGCARCHDHKFDPVPTSDYYSLAGIFTSTQVMEGRYMLGQQRVMERLFGLGESGADLDDAYEAYWRESPKLHARLAKANEALEHLKNANEDGLASTFTADEMAVAEMARDIARPKEERVLAQQETIAAIDKAIQERPPIPPRAMVAAEGEKPADEAIRLAGDYESPDEVVPRGILQVLSDTEHAVKIPADQSGRLQLAKWLTDVDHGAGRLTARVLANRVWHHVFGQGIVRTTDNFGRTGDLPSHPKLLDYLAQRLIDSGWSLKALVREVVLSRANRMNSHHNATARDIDPENRLLWRFNRRRLDPESLRDALLSAAGQLDLMPLDSSVDYLTDQATGVGNGVRRRTDFPNRSIYLPVIRNDLPELFDVFDFANPQMTTGRRPETTVATQALFVLNDTMVMDAADATARRVLARSSDSRERTRYLFELLLNVEPTDEDRRAILQFVDQIRPSLASENKEASEVQAEAWGMACHSLVASSRFQILE